MSESVSFYQLTRLAYQKIPSLFRDRKTYGSTTALGRDDALDGIRGLAVIGIVTTHLKVSLMPGGWIGVDVFFVLSGFLITNIVTREIDTTDKFKLGRFYWRRILRLWPAFFSMLALTLLLTQALPEVGVTPVNALVAASFMMNWCRAFTWLNDVALGHCWTLAVEQQFYLLWPLILMVVPARKRVLVTAALVVAIVSWRCWLTLHGASLMRVSNGLDTHSDGLLIGALLAFADRAVASAPSSWPGRALLTVGSAMLLSAGLFGELLIPLDLTVSLTVGFTVAAMAGAALIAVVRRQGWLRDMFSFPPLVVIGRLSYGIYLWHHPLLMWGRVHFYGIGMIVPISMSVVFAAISFRYIEQPILRWGTRSKRGLETASVRMATA